MIEHGKSVVERLLWNLGVVSSNPACAMAEWNLEVNICNDCPFAKRLAFRNDNDRSFGYDIIQRSHVTSGIITLKNRDCYDPKHLPHVLICVIPTTDDVSLSMKNFRRDVKQQNKLPINHKTYVMIKRCLSKTALNVSCKTR